MRKIHVIGVGGGSASGKTTIVKKIQEYFGEDIVILGHDSYYKAHDNMDYEARSQLNYDHPNSFETERMVEDVRKLMNGQAVDIPVYDYTIHNRAKETEHIEPKKLIIPRGGENTIGITMLKEYLKHLLAE